MEEYTGTTNRKMVAVAVDESEESMHALSWCLNNLILISPQSSQTTLVLLYVKPPPPVFSPMDAAGFLFAGDVTSALHRYGDELASSVMARADCVLTNFSNIYNVNVNVEKKVGRGDAKAVICGMVDKIGADMLVMGCHGYGFFKRALLGSVSNHCSKNVKCPVIVVKRPVADN